MSIGDKINSNCKVRTKVSQRQCRQYSNDSGCVLMNHFGHVQKVTFFLNYHQRLLYMYQSQKISIILSTCRKIPVQCFTVSSRVIDFNRCCFILYKILMKRHIDFETLMISNNFYLVIFKLFYLSLVNIKKLRQKIDSMCFHRQRRWKM